MSLCPRTISRYSRTLLRSACSSNASPYPSLSTSLQNHRLPVLSPPKPRCRSFHGTPRFDKGLQPDSSDPPAPSPQPAVAGEASHVSQPADITTDEYHEIADEYIDTLVAGLEAMAEDVEKGIEIDHSAGVLTLQTPHGTYVLNKQPPNKQIWLSSPISGPKRYDWVIIADSQHQKAETDSEGATDLKGGSWVYLRDGSLLTDLLKKEVKVDFKASETGE